jgi:drug/metabolite transporter (DMT)-like permease
VAFRDLPPVLFMTLRFGLASLIMAPLALRGPAPFDRRAVASGVPVGLALAAANVSFVLGVHGTSVSRAGFLNNLFVLIVPLACWLLWRQHPGRATGAGILLATAGIWLLAGGTLAGLSRGDLISLLCAVFISLHIILVHRLVRSEAVLPLTTVQFVTVTAVGALLSPFFPGDTLRFTPLALTALAYCAIFPTAVCFTLQNRHQRHVSPAAASLVYTLDPLWSMAGGMFFLGERLTALELAGCALILSGALTPCIAALRTPAPSAPQAP